MEGGEPGGGLMKEEALPRPTTFYAATKQAVESIGHNYARWCGVDFAAVRYGAVAGPWSGKGGGGPSNIFREAVLRALHGEESVIPPTGLEWVYSKDAAEGTVLALRTAQRKNRVFNLSMGRVCQPEEMAAALKAVLPAARVRIETPPATAVALVQSRPGDLTLAREVLGFAPRYDIPAAIKDMAEWLRRRNADVSHH